MPLINKKMRTKNVVLKFINFEVTAEMDSWN